MWDTTDHYPCGGRCGAAVSADLGRLQPVVDIRPSLNLRVKAKSADPVNCSMSSMCCLGLRANVPVAFVRRLIGRDNLVCIAIPHG